MPTTSKNLGQVAATISSSTAPTNTNVVWLDTSGSTTIKKVYDPIALAWIPLTQVGTVAGDNWGTQVVVTDATLAGTGITGNVLKIARQGATSGQVLKWNGTTWGPANENPGGLTSVSHNATIDGDGTTGNPLSIAKQNATNGQVLTWNGTAWIPQAPNTSGYVQTGMIVFWSGKVTSVPSGWQLCNGSGNLSNGDPIPDLRGMFIVGYNENDPDYNLIGKGGGSKAVQLTANQNGTHTHGIIDNGHSHGLGNGVVQVYSGINNHISGGGNDGGSNLVKQTANATTGITLQTSGSGAPHENRPPYYTLAYIIKL